MIFNFTLFFPSSPLPLFNSLTLTLLKLNPVSNAQKARHSYNRHLCIHIYYCSPSDGPRQRLSCALKNSTSYRSRQWC